MEETMIVSTMWKGPCDIFCNVESTIWIFHILEITMYTFHCMERMVKSFHKIGSKIIHIPQYVKKIKVKIRNTEGLLTTIVN